MEFLEMFCKHHEFFSGCLDCDHVMSSNVSSDDVGIVPSLDEVSSMYLCSLLWLPAFAMSFLLTTCQDKATPTV